MYKIHLDTDLGGDIDDLCALAMLLRLSDDVELNGITTVAEANGRRAGYVRYILGLEGKNDIRVAAGADVSQGFYRFAELGYPAEERYWPEPIKFLPNSVDDAIDLLKQSIEQGATIIAIGPFTNSYLLELQYPGILMDWNIQVDVKSAKHVLENSNPTLIPLSVTVETALRRAYLDDLREAGALGQLIAQQSKAFAIDEQNEMRFGETCEGLPHDIINFQHDPLACAIALGWNEGIEIEELPLSLEEKDGWLHERTDPAGKPVRVVTKVDGPRFNEFWLNKVVNRYGNHLSLVY